MQITVSSRATKVDNLFRAWLALAANGPMVNQAAPITAGNFNSPVNLVPVTIAADMHNAIVCDQGEQRLLDNAGV